MAQPSTSIAQHNTWTAGHNMRFNVAHTVYRPLLLDQLQSKHCVNAHCLLLDHLNYITCPQIIYFVYHVRVALTIWALRIIKIIHEGQTLRILVACDLNTTNHLVIFSNATILATPIHLIMMDLYYHFLLRFCIIFDMNHIYMDKYGSVNNISCINISQAC